MASFDQPAQESAQLLLRRIALHNPKWMILGSLRILPSVGMAGALGPTDRALRCSGLVLGCNEKVNNNQDNYDMDSFH